MLHVWYTYPYTFAIHIHETNIFTYMKTYQNQSLMEVNMPVPWIVWGMGKKGHFSYCTKKGGLLISASGSRFGGECLTFNLWPKNREIYIYMYINIHCFSFLAPFFEGSFTKTIYIYVYICIYMYIYIYMNPNPLHAPLGKIYKKTKPQLQTAPPPSNKSPLMKPLHPRNLHRYAKMAIKKYSTLGVHVRFRGCI